MVEFLEKNCNQALESIRQNPSTAEAIESEQTLWKNIIKIYKENSDPMLINYLLGFYMTLHELLFFNSPCRDIFLKNSRHGFVLANSNQELLYNIHIRIGDLYRYVECRENAKKYYQKALQIDPRRGFAYNQLALCTPLTKAYQCIYFSIRAFNSTVDPWKGADSNIKLSIARLDCPVFESFRQSQDIKMDENSIKVALPESGPDWFYLIVICIHLNDLNLALNLLLDRILNLIDYDLKSNNLDFLLMSLDVALDWILKDRSQFANSTSIESLKSFNSQLKMNQNTTFPLEETDTIALVHNSILKDFQPLENVYQKMDYFYETENYQISKHRKILISRLINKLQKF